MIIQATNEGVSEEKLEAFKKFIHEIFSSGHNIEQVKVLHKKGASLATNTRAFSFCTISICGKCLWGRGGGGCPWTPALTLHLPQSVNDLESEQSKFFTCVRYHMC